MTEQAATPPKTSPAAPATTSPPAAAYTLGTGRRKTAVARVRLRAGKGDFRVNAREFKAYFPNESDQTVCQAPLRATETIGKIDVFVTVHGGGPSGQAGAVSLGLSRALLRYDTAHEGALRNGQFLTRDSRKVERKKYGRSGARKRFQYSKR